MDRPLAEYFERGGKQIDIARSWGVSKANVNSLVKRKGDQLRVEFNPRKPSEVYRLYLPEQRQVVIPEHNYFDIAPDAEGVKNG